LADADAWYFILEGTRERSVAETQAMAITELAAHAATSPYGEPRAMLLAADDYSAVSGRVPLSNLYERAGPWASGYRYRRNPGRGLAGTRTNDTGSRPPPTAASSSFALLTRSR
jgi:hypothetical protein